MVLDVRYQIVTLAAVFLALGLGVLIGSALVGNDALIDQQVKLIDRLEQDFAQVKAEREDLRARLAVAEARLKAAAEFQHVVFPALTGGRLAGRRVALVRTGDSLDRRAQEELVSVLEGAGASVGSVTVVTRPLDLASGESRDEVLACLGIPADASVNVGTVLAGAIAREVVGGASAANTAVLESLERLGYVTFSGGYGAGADVVVVMGGGSQDLPAQGRSVDASLVEALRSLNVTVVACEAASSRTSCVRAWRAAGAATVDNADTPVGQLSVVLAAAGARGSYGTKDTAKALVPSFWGGSEAGAATPALPVAR